MAEDQNKLQNEGMKTLDLYGHDHVPGNVGRGLGKAKNSSPRCFFPFLTMSPAQTTAQSPGWPRPNPAETANAGRGITVGAMTGAFRREPGDNAVLVILQLTEGWR